MYILCRIYASRGHGTFFIGESLHSAVAGTVDRVNKLISVKPLRSRYSGEIGDVVIGRIIDVNVFNEYSMKH
jgi:exosome complex component RRP4